MSNEVTFSSLSDARTAEVLLGAYAQLRADRNGLPNHPALGLYRRLPVGALSNVITVPAFGLQGYDQMSAYATEVSAPSNTALTTAAYQVTIVRQALRREHGWLARHTDGQGVLSPQAVAADMYGAYRMRLAAMIAALMSGFSASVGSSGVDLSVAQFLAAKIALGVANATDSAALAMLHTVQVGDLEIELATASGGTVQWDPESAALTRSFGGGFVGRLLGVDICKSNQVATANAGADRAGGMFVANAIIWGDAILAVEDPNSQVMVGEVRLERDRDAANDLTQWVGAIGLGVAEADDGRGIGIVTDA